MIKNLKDDILNFSCSFKKTEFSFIPRELNGAIYSLAKFDFERRKNLELIDSFFDSLKDYEMLV